MTKTSTLLSRSIRLTLTLCLAGLAGGCVMEEDELGVVLQEGNNDGTCIPGNGCPTNAQAGNLHLGYLRPDGVKNDKGFGIKTYGNVYEVINGQLYENNVAMGQDDTFDLYRDGDIYRMELMEQPRLEQGFTVYQNYNWIYTFGFDDDNDPETPPIPICEELDGDPANHEAVLVEGETYTVNDTIIDRTGGVYSTAFTIACIRGALAKMARFDLDPTDPGAQTNAAIADRQATLWMGTASYCGDAHSFTKLGTEIGWLKLDGTVNAVPAGAVVEALWTDAGALCITRPRLSDGNPARTQSIINDAEAQCGYTIPSCDSGDFANPANWPLLATWATFWVP